MERTGSHWAMAQGRTLMASTLRRAMLHLLLEAGAVRPGLRQDVQGRDARPVQAARDGLPHLLVRRAVPAAGRSPQHVARKRLQTSL